MSRYSTMELPDDILHLIRDLSRPRMRFYQEYRQYLTELGFEQHEHWYVVRHKLCTSDAERVFDAFLVYKEATIALKQFHKSDCLGPYSVYRDILQNLILTQTKAENHLDRTLTQGSCVSV